MKFCFKAVFHSAKKSEQTENSTKCMRSLITTVQYQKTKQRKLAEKNSWKFSTFLADFLSWNFNSQSDFVLLPTTFFNMASNKASNNETPHEIYLGFSDDVIRNFLFQRQLYQPGGSQQRFFSSNMKFRQQQQQEENRR